MPDELQPKPEAAAMQASNRQSNSGKFRFSVALFLAALVLLFVVTPFVDDLKDGDALDATLVSLVLVSGALAVGRRRRTLVLAVILLLPAFISRWVYQLRPELLPPEVYLMFALVFIVFIMFELLNFILRAPRVNSDVLCAGIAGYLMLGIIWTNTYVLVARMDPAAFCYNVGPPATHVIHSFDMMYFSFITLSTVGYGDITPLSHAARMLAMTEAMTGTIYIAVLISRLVALYSSQSPEAPERKN